MGGAVLICVDASPIPTVTIHQFRLIPESSFLSLLTAFTTNLADEHPIVAGTDSQLLHPAWL